MSNGVKNYIVRLSSEGEGKVTAAFGKIQKDGKAAFEKIGESSVNLNNRFGTLAGTLTSRLLPAISLIGVQQYVRSAISDLTELADTSKRLGIAASALQELQYAAQKNGSSAATLSAGWEVFTKQVALAQQGTGKLLPYLEQSNIALKNSSGVQRNAYEIMLDYADAIAKADSDQRKLIMTTSAFGSSQSSLVELMGQGSEAIKGYSQDANDLGLVIEDSLIKKAAEFDSAIKQFSTSLSTQGKAAVIDFISTVQSIFTERNVLGKSSIPDQTVALEGRLREYRSVQKEMDVLRKQIEGGRLKGIDDELLPLDGAERLQKRYDKLKNSFTGNDLAKINAEIARVERLIERAPSKNSTGALAKQLDYLKKIKSGLGDVGVTADTLSKSIGDESETNGTMTGGISALNKGVSKLGKNTSDVAKNDFGDLNEQADKFNEAANKFDDAANSFGDSWAYNVQRMLSDGQTLDDFFKNIGIDLVNNLFSTYLYQPISSGVSGIAKDLFSPLMSSLPSFDVGTNRVPYDMVAKIHKDEAIIPAYEAEKMRNGTDAPRIQVNINNRSGADVAVQQGRNAQGGSTLEVMITEATSKAIRGGMLDQAMMNRFNVNRRTTGR